MNLTHFVHVNDRVRETVIVSNRYDLPIEKCSQSDLEYHLSSFSKYNQSEKSKIAKRYFAIYGWECFDSIGPGYAPKRVAQEYTAEFKEFCDLYLAFRNNGYIGGLYSDTR